MKSERQGREAKEYIKDNLYNREFICQEIRADKMHSDNFKTNGTTVWFTNTTYV